MGLIENRSVP